MVEKMLEIQEGIGEMGMYEIFRLNEDGTLVQALTKNGYALSTWITTMEEAENALHVAINAGKMSEHGEYFLLPRIATL